MISASDRRIIHHRTEELFREVGALLIAFAPLDAALASSEPNRWGYLLLFMSLGTLLTLIALIYEFRRSREH